MARLIDAEKLEELMCRQCNIECGEEPCEPDDCFVLNVIRDRPTVDAVPVVHGRWVWDSRFHDYYCSKCHDWDLKTPNFCKNCGAKMDLEVKNG